ncbi:MAG: hypothetical protein SVV80_03520 [Planctomycetota bacterium]|nr:hypothetical protein [Planctomycetota bacterium]
MAEQVQNEEVPASIECPATREPAVRLFIVAGIFIGFGIWCFVDAHIKKKYPPEMKEGNTSDVFTYYFNHGGAVVFPLLGLIPLGLAVASLRRKLLADDKGIGYAGKRQITWSAVKSLDSSQLADKGILRLEYETGGGQKTLKLCSWKLQNFRSLVMLLENKVPSGS